MQALATVLYKVHCGLATENMNDIFKIRKLKYNFRNDFSFATRNVESPHYGSKNISYLDPKIYNLLPKCIKDLKNTNISKSSIKGNLRYKRYSTF